jgi:hypothetical protein
MNNKTKNILFWIIAIVFTLSLIIYQRATGPTYPLKGSIEIAGEVIDYRLLRSHNTDIDAPVVIVTDNIAIRGTLRYKRYKSYDEWTDADMMVNEDGLEAAIPFQPPAGKVMYNVVLHLNGTDYVLNEEPAIIRFKGAVPLAVLTPHIFFMFFSLLFGVRAGIEAVGSKKDTYFFTSVALLTVTVGGLILGPIVQKYAFDAYWTGWPFGHDLTDNKTAVIFIFWLIAWWKLRKNPKHTTMVVAATIVMIIVYIIPHSVLGSEIDHTKQSPAKTEIQE